MKQNKAEILLNWHQNNEHFYDYVYENPLDYPCTSCQWGPVITSNEQYSVHKVYYACRTGNHYSDSQNSWKGAPNYIAIGTVQVPNLNYYFIPQLRAVFGNGDGKMFSNLKVRNVIHHPGEVTVIRALPLNKKIFASKNQSNQVFIWTNDKYKTLNTGCAHNPDITLLTTKSVQPNFALSFTPSFPRIATASGSKIQIFDLESAASRRQLGSVTSSSVIAPTISLQANLSTVKQKVEDIAFKDKNNQICVTGGHAKKLGMWDLRLGKNLEFIEGVFEGDIHSISWKDNFILAGASDGKIAIIDQRMTKSPIFTHQKQNQILAVHWSPDGRYFGVGSDNLYFYQFSRIQQTKQFTPLLTHSGMRGAINDFDWGNDCQWNIISTCHQAQSGGSLHVFRPVDLLYLSKEQAAEKLQKVFQGLSPQDQALYI